jgi:hypothetical protein
MQATCKLIMMAFGLCSTYYLFYDDAVYPRAPDAGNTFSSSLIKNISAKIQDFPRKVLI